MLSHVAQKHAVLPEQTEDGTARGEGDQRQAVTQSVQRLHDHVEDELQARDERRNHCFILSVFVTIDPLCSHSQVSDGVLVVSLIFSGVYMLVKAARDTARSADFILSFLLSSKLRFFFSHCLNKYINQWRTEHYTGLSSVGKDVPPLRPHLLRFFYSGDITQLILLNLSRTRKEG